MYISFFLCLLFEMFFQWWNKQQSLYLSLASSRCTYLHAWWVGRYVHTFESEIALGIASSLFPTYRPQSWEHIQWMRRRKSRIVSKRRWKNQETTKVEVNERSLPHTTTLRHESVLRFIYIYIYMRGWMIKYFSCVEGKWLPVSPVAGDIVCDTAASAGRNTTVTAVLRERGLHVLNVFFAQLDPTPIPFRIRRVYWIPRKYFEFRIYMTFAVAGQTYIFLDLF